VVSKHSYSAWKKNLILKCPNVLKYNISIEQFRCSQQSYMSLTLYNNAILTEEVIEFEWEHDCEWRFEKASEGHNLVLCIVLPHAKLDHVLV
jgi:hypothetical protein